jgi:hypothetical protein
VIQDLNSDPHACQADTLALEPLLPAPPFFCNEFFKVGSYKPFAPGLVLNCNLPDVCFQSRREPPVPLVPCS